MPRNLLIIAVSTIALGASHLSFSQQSASSPPAANNAHLRRHRAPTLTVQQSGTTNRLQAISPVNSRVVWASGLGGTYTVTTDGGKTWHAGVVSGAETLQ